jgi:hypothetical protein
VVRHLGQIDDAEVDLTVFDHAEHLGSGSETEVEPGRGCLAPNQRAERGEEDIAAEPADRGDSKRLRAAGAPRASSTASWAYSGK